MVILTVGTAAPAVSFWSITSLCVPRAKVYSPVFISVPYPPTRASILNMKALGITPARSSFSATIERVSPFTTSILAGPAGSSPVAAA